MYIKAKKKGKTLFLLLENASYRRDFCMHGREDLVELTKYLVKYERTKNPIGVTRTQFKLTRFLINFNSCRSWIPRNLVDLKVANVS